MLNDGQTKMYILNIAHVLNLFTICLKYILTDYPVFTKSGENWANSKKGSFLSINFGTLCFRGFQQTFLTESDLDGEVNF